MRINKYLSHSGVCSRRQADNLILRGKVSINGNVVTELGIDVSKDDIVKVNNKTVRLISNYEYYLLNKPIGYVSTVKDPYAKKTIMDLIDSEQRLYPVGRLDKDSHGLIIVTNDGDITNKLTHPKKNIFKTYIVILDKEVSFKDIKLLENGIFMDNSKTKKSRILKISKFKYKISISEGRNRQVRRMFKHIDANVIDLERVSIGNIRDGKLKEGQYRKLTNEELKYLRSL